MTPELQAVVARLEEIEKQNQRVRRLSLLLMLAPVLLIMACVSRPSSVVEAQKFVLRDSNGRVRIEITMDHDNPTIRLFDENGKVRTMIGAGDLSIQGDKGTNAMLLDGTLQFNNENGMVARLGALADSGLLWLVGKDKSDEQQTVLLDSSEPNLQISDSRAFTATLGRSDLVTPKTGEAETTSAASLVLSASDKKIIWRSPR
jgi:hypothetical protein